MMRWTSVALLAATACLAACDSIDPTAQTFGITFQNDTGSDVVVKLCDNDDCSRFDYHNLWRRGDVGEYNISDRAVLTRWLVANAETGATLGCLPLEFDQKYADVKVRMTQMVPCPGTTPLIVQRGKPRGRS